MVVFVPKFQLQVGHLNYFVCHLSFGVLPSDTVVDWKDTSGFFNLNLQGTTCEMIVEFEFEVAKEFGIKVLKSAKKERVIGYNVEKEEIYIDRGNSGEATINGFFPSIYLSSIEVFANNGKWP